MMSDKFGYLLAEKSIIVLHIEDEYQFMDIALIEILEDTVTPYLNEI